jgi:hypothetical protein
MGTPGDPDRRFGSDARARVELSCGVPVNSTRTDRSGLEATVRAVFDVDRTFKTPRINLGRLTPDRQRPDDTDLTVRPGRPRPPTNPQTEGRWRHELHRLPLLGAPEPTPRSPTTTRAERRWCATQASIHGRHQTHAPYSPWPHPPKPHPTLHSASVPRETQNARVDGLPLRAFHVKRCCGRVAYASIAVTTRWRSGSSPSLWVATPPRSRRYSWTCLRSLAVIASSATGRPNFSQSIAA